MAGKLNASPEPLRFGLSEAIHADFRSVFASFPEIERVLIFGSRAKGTARPDSDIDLAISAPGMHSARFAQLWNELDALPLVFRLDVLHLEQITQPALREAVLRDGQDFVPT